jgi:hypothetical protein
MSDASVKRQTITATIGFVVYIVLYTLLRDVMSGQPVNLIGPLFSGVVGAAVFGGIFYAVLSWRRPHPHA